jgi:glycerol-1-phosphate dehydrogenase [NAD(P)+]
MGRIFLLIKKISRWFLNRPLLVQDNAALGWLQTQKNCLVITSKSPYSQSKALLDMCGQILIDPPVDIDQLNSKISEYSQSDFSWVVGIGGGKIMDISKFIALDLKKKLCLIPTALSTTAWLNMAIALRKEGKLYFPGQKHANLTLVDPSIIRNSPDWLSLGGIADILCAVTAMTDWKISHGETGEKYSEHAYVAYREWIENMIQNANKLVPFDGQAVRFEIDAFLDSLALCGAAMSGRPLEGSEHFLYYCLDEKSPLPIIHGGAIALGILICLRLQGETAMLKPKVMQAFFDKVGVVYRPSDLNLSTSLLSEALKAMPEFVIRRKLPYSLWNLPDLYIEENTIEKIIDWVANF